jgi:hypothetical protein
MVMGVLNRPLLLARLRIREDEEEKEDEDDSFVLDSP